MYLHTKNITTPHSRVVGQVSRSVGIEKVAGFWLL